MNNVTKYLPEIVLGAVAFAAGMFLYNWLAAKIAESKAAANKPAA